jgi:hypothetical protein
MFYFVLSLFNLKIIETMRILILVAIFLYYLLYRQFSQYFLLILFIDLMMFYLGCNNNYLTNSSSCDISAANPNTTCMEPTKCVYDNPLMNIKIMDDDLIGSINITIREL